jgi:N6-adenosine-specific RNA methylase IME4
MRAVESAAVRIASITVGKRFRRAMGDIDSLARSIADIGLLHPIVLNTDRKLIVGERRFLAAKMLGWKTIPATILDLDALIDAEADENRIRKAFTPSERVAIGRALESQLGERQGKRADLGKLPQKFAEVAGRETRDVAAEKAGFDNHTTYEQAKAVIDSGVLELVEAMDDDRIAISLAAAATRLPKDQQAKVGKLAKNGDSRAVKKVVKAARREQLERELAGKQLALPDKKYGVILADPEWKFETWSSEGMIHAADNHYATSTVEAIAQRDVPSIAADDCVLFLWGTVPMLPQALYVMQRWGFSYKTNFAWIKDKAGTGYWNRNRHEHLLVGTKGNIPAPALGTQWDSVIEAAVGRHSAKPERSLELIETYFPTLPKIELNRRGAPRPGWDAWGAETC